MDENLPDSYYNLPASLEDLAKEIHGKEFEFDDEANAPPLDAKGWEELQQFAMRLLPPDRSKELDRRCLRYKSWFKALISLRGVAEEN